MKICFTGVRPLGGVQMRGVQTARLLGVPFLDLEREFLKTKTVWDAVVLVKYHRGQGAAIRERAVRLIYDPLDCWSSLHHWKDRPAIDFWRWTRCELGYDDILATSPACAMKMYDANPTVNIHMLRHHADTTIVQDVAQHGRWYDPAGPIVYAGGLRFLGGQEEYMRRSARALGRQLIINIDRCCERTLKGASLAISPRLHPEDTDLNAHCKPTIKAANAAVAGLPFLCTDDPAHRSAAYDNTCFIDRDLNWESNFAKALNYPPLEGGTSLADHANALEEIIMGKQPVRETESV